jgi:hypothetical protein
MNKRLMRAVSALGAGLGLIGSTVAVAGAADAAVAGIRNPTLTVVCTEPHHGNVFTAVRFRQHGAWATGGAVLATVANGLGARPKAAMHTKTLADGTFRLRRTLHSGDTGTWVAGATYTWTTEVAGKTWAVARRGTVKLTGSC